MTTTVPHRAPTARLLTPVTAALRAMPAADDRFGLVPGLLVHDDAGWFPATRLVDGSRLRDLFELARCRWRAPAPAAAALAWKYYSYWLALPAVVGWAAARRVPLLHPADVLVRIDGRRPRVTLGVRPSVTVAVLPSDRLASGGAPGARPVADERALLATLRGSLLDAHLSPMIQAIRAEVRVGTRTLLGSVSSGIAHGLLRTGGALPGPPARHVGTVLATLGIENLIELVPGPAGEPAVRRRTCCLAFTLPRPKICAGCCITPPGA